MGIYFALLVGAALMLIPMEIQRRWYSVSFWKGIVLIIVMILIGLYGSKLWYYLENGNFMGRSFYGAVLLEPVVLLVVSKIIKLQYTYSLDFCATSGSLCLALVKIQCMLDNCCRGKALYVNENYEYVHFPSQLVEFATLLIISVVLLCISHKEKNRGRIYPLFMLIYGVTRFVLNLLREETTAFFIGLPAGNVWSLVSIIAGTIWLVVFYRKRKTKIEQEQ